MAAQPPLDWSADLPASTQGWPRRVALIAGCSVVVVSLVVFAGWILDLEVAKSIVPGAARLAPATAAGFFCCGFALLLLATDSMPQGASESRTRSVYALALAALLIGTAKLGDYLGLWSLNFDTLGFRDTAFVAPSTAMAFTLAGTALLLARSERFFVLFQSLVMALLIIGWVGFTSFISGGERLPVYAQMAVHTSATFLCLGVGLVSVRSDRGLMTLLTGWNRFSKNILWLLILAPLLPFLIDWIGDIVEREGTFGALNLTPILTVLDTLLLTGLIWIFAVRLKHIDDQRSQEQARRREYEATFALFVEHAPAAIAMFDTDMRYVAVSRRWLNEFQLKLEEIQGRSHYDVFPALSERWKEFHRRGLAGHVEKCDRDRMEDAAGESIWVRWEIRPWESIAGQVGGIMLFSEDITERVEAEARIARLNRMHAVLSAINVLIVRVRDSRTLFEEACRTFVEVGGFGVAWIGLYHRNSDKIVPSAAAGLPLGHPLLPELTVSNESGENDTLSARAVAQGDPVYENDLTSARCQQSPRKRAIAAQGYMSAIALPLIVDGFPTGCISLWSENADIFDDDELKLLLEASNDIAFALQYLTKQEELDYVSYYDVLTGLPNRTLFLDRLSQELRSHRQRTGHVVLVIVDLERFRIVNESLGRHGGDELLRAVAKRFRQPRPDSSLARIGSNSFAFTISDVNTPADIVAWIESAVLGPCREPFSILGTEVRVAARAGVALYPSDGENSEALFRNAEAALKKAKEVGEAYLFYSAEMNAQAESQLRLETRLRKAVDASEFVLYYQPKIILGTRKISGLEALIRWRDPERGLVSPADFIPLLESTGLIVQVGYWVMRQALSDYRRLADAGYQVPRIAVNVSAVQLMREDFASSVMDLLQETNTETEALELEITESLVMQNIDRSNRTLSVLRGTGVMVSMDDFGTGYSSLSYLATLPIDKVKIDRAFVAGMTGNARDRKVVSTVISLAHSFDLPVVAEGVETVDQAKALHELHCDEAQGFLFSRPMPFEDVHALLSQQERPSASG